MNELYSYNDFRYYKNGSLKHSWGTSPEQKLREKEYNKAYYQAHKHDIWGVGDTDSASAIRNAKKLSSMSDEDLDMHLLSYAERESDEVIPFSKEDYRTRDKYLNEYYKRHPEEKHTPKKRLEDTKFAKLMGTEDDDADDYSELYNEICEKSGDWYNSKSNTRNFQKVLDYRSIRQQEIADKYNTDEKYRKASSYHDEFVLEKTKQYWEPGKDKDYNILKKKYQSGPGEEEFNKAWDKAWEDAENDPQYKKLRKAYNTARQKEFEEERKLHKEIEEYFAGAILNDLGYEDTDEARKILIRSGMIFPD